MAITVLSQGITSTGSAAGTVDLLLQRIQVRITKIADCKEPILVLPCKIQVVLCLVDSAGREQPDNLLQANIDIRSGFVRRIQRLQGCVQIAGLFMIRRVRRDRSSDLKTVASRIKAKPGNKMAVSLLNKASIPKKPIPPITQYQPFRTSSARCRLPCM